MSSLSFSFFSVVGPEYELESPETGIISDLACTFVIFATRLFASHPSRMKEFYI